MWWFFVVLRRALVWLFSSKRQKVPLCLVQEIPLPGLEGRVDHMAVDDDRHLLIVSALGSDKCIVVNVFKGTVQSMIGRARTPQGVLYVKSVDKLFLASADLNVVSIYEAVRPNTRHASCLNDFEFVNDVPFEEPDNLRFDSTRQLVYVGYGEGGIGVIDAVSNVRVAEQEFTFEGHPEGFQLQETGPHVFVNVEDTRSVLVLNRDTKSQRTFYTLPEGFNRNFPLALDENKRVVFVGVRRPPRLVVLDMDNGTLLATMPSVGDMDDIFYDAPRRRIYVIGGEGFVSVFQQESRSKYTLLGHTPTDAGARTGMWYPSRDLLYVACPARGSGRDAKLLVYAPHD